MPTSPSSIASSQNFESYITMRGSFIEPKGWHHDVTPPESRTISTISCVRSSAGPSIAYHTESMSAKSSPP